jgi:hypothetical protein
MDRINRQEPEDISMEEQVYPGPEQDIPEEDDGVNRPDFQEDAPPRRSLGSRVSGFVSSLPRIPLPAPPNPEPEEPAEELTVDDMTTISEDDEDFIFGVPDELTEDDPSLYQVSQKDMDNLTGTKDIDSMIGTGKRRVRYSVSQSSRKGKNRPGTGGAGLYGTM